MPNWCNNNVTITANNERAVEAIKELQHFLTNKSSWIVQDHDDEIGLLSFICPLTDEDQRDAWGTKWDVHASNIVHSMIETSNEETLSLHFLTAWGPAIRAFESWQQKMRESGVDLSIRIVYEESGFDFIGYWLDGVDDFMGLHDLYRGLVAKNPDALAFAKEVDTDVETLAETYFCYIRMNVKDACDCALCKSKADDEKNSNQQMKA